MEDAYLSVKRVKLTAIMIDDFAILKAAQLTQLLENAELLNGAIFSESPKAKTAGFEELPASDNS